VVIVVILPLLELFVEQVNIVRNPVAIEELVELLVVDAMGSFDLAVQVWCPRPDVDVADVEGFEMPVKLRLKLRPVLPSPKEGHDRTSASLDWVCQLRSKGACPS
jgi:hypothetical protein